MKFQKSTILLFLVLLTGICRSQQVTVLNNNKNVKLTVKVITVHAKHFIIPDLKVFSDTQNIQVHKQIIYASENIPIADCHFSLQKLIKNELVNMYASKLFDPFADDELIKFTTNDSLEDTVCIEHFIPLEPGQYVVSLAFNYYRNGVKDIVYSNEAVFFVRPASSYRRR